MAGGSWTLVYTATLGATITHTERNTEFQNVINNQYPAVFDDHQATLAEMRTISDPYASQVAVQATNLGIELEQYRYQFVQAAKARGLNPTYWYEDITGMYAASSGTNTITATFDPPLYAHTTGLPLLIKAGGTNTGATTFDPNGLGSKNVYVGASALTSGQITLGKGYWLMFDGTQYQLLNPETSAIDTITSYTAASTNIITAQCTGRTVITNYNAGATQTEFVLPNNATAGLITHFLVSAESGDTGGIKITAGAADIINESGITTATGGNVQYSAGGLMITATCYVNGKWTLSKKGAEEIAIFKDEKGSGADGGTSSTGNNIRVLNTTTINKIKNAALASNRISLPAGTYEFEAEAVCENGNQHSIFMRNYTDSSTPAGTLGIASRANGAGIETTATLKGTVSITATKEFELYHYIASGLASNGLGRPVSSGNSEVYATVKVKRL